MIAPELFLFAVAAACVGASQALDMAIDGGSRLALVAAATRCDDATLAASVGRTFHARRDLPPAAHQVIWPCLR
ncbi:hypothetical protein [Actinoplanes flavus]|uniref:Uncharacterized protein n=1 Tax=Actinoplanes flavus TaxID=2820290 RepID=A0ABS3UCX1_9ACTN|nr:hypothetical protein [Actinoplanes flavus]MBO3736612.1 hypothetical protein [Actinoplanes flavus]